MFRYIVQRRSLLIGSLAFLAGLAFASFGLGAKPGGGGGGGGVEGGTIYFDVLWAPGGAAAMSPTGANKVQLPDNVWYDPSRMLHGGHRWFLDKRTIVGEIYANGTSQRYEFFAVRDDGNEAWTVQLTSDPTLQFLGGARWAPAETEGSAFIGGLARRWNADGTVDPDSVGVYVAEVLFDADGNALGTVGPPVFVVSLGIVPGTTSGTWFDDTDGTFDWSPDMLEIVCVSSDQSELRVFDVLTGTHRVVASSGFLSAPAWSPAGNLIAFYNAALNNGNGAIETVDSSGGNRRVIIQDRKAICSKASWSPAGGYLIYQRTSGPSTDIYRATSTGGSKTNLTGDISDPVSPIAWR